MALCGEKKTKWTRSPALPSRKNENPLRCRGLVSLREKIGCTKHNCETETQIDLRFLQFAPDFTSCTRKAG